MQVELYVDPACGWSQVAVRWLQEVARRRDVQLRLQPYSLLLRDGVDHQPAASAARRRAALRALRVLEQVVDGDDPVRAVAFWDAVVAQDGPEPFQALDAAGADAGIGAAAGAADHERVDQALAARMAVADELAGGRAVLPLLVLDGRVAFTGPLVRDAPAGAAAAALWDAVVALAATEGFYALSRPRPAHPAIPGLPAVDVPPSLAPALPLEGPLGQVVRAYVERVVNRRDLTALDELVAPDYEGGGLGWPGDRAQLRAFYEDQVRDRPDWHIDVQQTLELGEHVVARALAGGTVLVDGRPHRRQLEWLAQYRVVDGLIREIRLLSVVPATA